MFVSILNLSVTDSNQTNRDLKKPSKSYFDTISNKKNVEVHIQIKKKVKIEMI